MRARGRLKTIELEPVDPRKLVAISRGKRRPFMHGVGGNQQVHCADGTSLRLKRCSDFAVDLRSVCRPIEHLDKGEELLQTKADFAPKCEGMSQWPAT